jgi:hypothetical protein
MTQQDFHDSMKKLVIFLTLWLGFMQVVRCEVKVSYEPSDWPQHTLKFSDEGTLKDIFDAGIRPYRFPSLEKSSLGFKHVRVAVLLKSGEQLPAIEVDWGNISPLDGGLLSSIEMTSPDLTIQEAESAMVPFLNKGERTIERLQKFLALAKSDPINYDDPYNGDSSKFAISWIDPEGPAYDVFLKKTFQSAKPVSIAMKVSFFPIRTRRQQRSFYDIPIPPPPGYENVSMEAPRNFGPDSAVEIARSKGIPITGDRTQEEYEKQQRAANDKNRAPKPKMPAFEPKSKSSDNPAIWTWLVGVIGLITVVVFVLRWKGKTTP